MSNTLDRILTRLEENDSVVVTKTAAAAAAAIPSAPSAEEKMLATVRSLTETSTKTASVADAPATGLEKLAADAHAAESQILTQKAAALGASLADGFMARFAQYDTALGDVAVKTASAPDVVTLTKEAYAAARADLEEQASTDFDQGYNDQLALVQKTAAHCHLSGQQSARNVLSALSEA